MRNDIDAELDALFKLPLNEFTAARNALAARLKKAGRTSDADRVKVLAKPPGTAWAVNQLYWQHPKDIDRLLALSEKARKAQAGGPGDLRALLDERRRLVSELTARATAILREGGHGVAPDATRRLGITIESLASWGRTDGAPRPGRLTSDLEPLGFDGLAALMGDKKLEPAKVLQFRIDRGRAAQAKKSAEEEAEGRARAKEALKSAEKALTAARREAERADATLEKATVRAEAVEKQKQEIEARYAGAKDEVRAASDQARKAAQTVAAAEKALQKARETLG
jgi:hypothetical protein